jgi:integrase
MNAPRLVVGSNVTIPDFTRDVAGHVVDLRSQKWRLHSPQSHHTLVNWKSLDGCDEEAIEALRMHIVRLIETSSVSHTLNAFKYVSDFLRLLSSDTDAPSRSINQVSLIWMLERLRAKRVGYKFHHIRQWYIASADRMLAGFDDEVVFSLQNLRVEGNVKGEAVLSHDPNEGPLSEFEEEALRSALLRDRGPIRQRAALWLSFAFGTNPANLALLREEDFKTYHFDGQAPTEHFLSIPRIKKRQPARSEFKTRLADGRLAEVLRELIEYNRTIAPDNTTRPLFRREIPRKTLFDGPLKEYAFHYTAAEITDLIAECVRRLDILSPRTRKPLTVTTRRLRYTFACKMVRQGIAARDLAELLDHTDLQHVQVYYKADSRFVERLDETVAKHLGPTIMAFMGQIIDRPAKPIDLITFRELPGLGQCGASFMCGLSAPKNCYTCPQFSAFKDGAHEAVLQSLVTERNELLAAKHERIAEQLDRTILAVGEVVTNTSGVKA